ncbi:uncharacterized protein N7479_011405 [Penicillium vulpinum]|uniref:uncharacterized protein n=1 Tax=Penicillium vulpinum TaxID=29845 RepID=UPI0025482534|nr:uncharacterized protein N7479_011405 [Penicillium vulpinum]KAJ5952992.1 hypothetical protein N7479_011405 [Penicillium vulpinum]
MHITAPSIALLALAAGVQAGGAKQQREPPVRAIRAAGKYQATAVAPTGATGTGITTGSHPIVTGSPNHEGTQTGSHPIVTGSPHHNGTNGEDNHGSIIGTGTAPCYNCHGSATIPSGSSEYTPSNPGSKVTAPQFGVYGALIGSIVYGAVMLLA